MPRLRPHAQDTGYPAPQVYLKCIDASHPAVLAFEVRIEAIQDELDSNNVPWRSIELFQASRDTVLYEPTLIIGVQQDCSVGVIQMAENITTRNAQIINTAGITIRTRVMHRGDRNPTIRPTASGKPLSPGSAVSRIDSKSNGSLGGFFAIGKKLYAVTCHHVAYGGLCGDPAMDIAPHSRGVKLMSPTWATELLQREKAEFKLEEAKRSLNTYLENCAARRLQPIHLHAFNVEVERYIKRLAGGPEDAVFGKVAVDCCNLHTIRWHNRTTSVDWSLVEVTPGIRCSNTIVDDDLGIEFADSTLTIKTFHSQGNLKHKRIEVWKKGMKTKLTHGRLNGTISRVQFETMDGQENLEATEELAVVAIGEGDLFSAPGDSGSWVFDQEGALIGMVLGGNEGNGASYISDAQMIRREICKIVDREPDIAQFRL